MRIFLNILKGVLMGIANIIPGVSGGTMAVSLGIYDKMIDSIGNILSNPKKSIKFLIPIIVGMGIGIVGFAYIIEYLLSKYPFPTSLAFIGLILGGLPSLWVSYVNSMRKKKRKTGSRPKLITPVNVILFVAFAALVIKLALASTENMGTSSLSTDTFSLIILFLVGVIAAGTMVIPGVSGSLVLMILGYYYGILGSIKDFVEGLRAFDMGVISHNTLILAPFGVGVLIGIVVIAKIIDYLFKNFAGATYSAILGLIIASPVAILINTGALSNVTLMGTIIGAVLFGGLGIITFIMGRE